MSKEALRWALANPKKAAAMANAARNTLQTLSDKRRANRAARGDTSAPSLSTVDRKMGRPKPSSSQQVSSAVAPPTSFGYAAGANSYSTSLKTKTSEMVRGSTILGTVQTNSSAAQIVGMYSLIPTLWGDRVATIAGTYDKYVFRNIKAVYTPMCSTSTSGSIMMYFERDAMDPPADPNNLQQFMSSESACLGPVYAKTESSIARDPFEKRTYFTAPGNSIDPHELMQFKLIVAANGAPANTQLGMITLVFDLEFIAPVFAPRELVSSVFNQYQFTVGNAQLTATSAATASAPFGISSSDWTQASVWEIVVVDLNGGAFNTTGGVIDFTYGSGGPLLPPARAGMVFYLTPQNINTVTTAVSFNLHTTYQSALTKGAGSVYNTTATTKSLFNSGPGVRIAYRAIGTPGNRIL